MMDMKQRIRAMIAQIEKDIAAGWTAEDHYLEPLRIALASLEAEPSFWGNEESLRFITKAIKQRWERGEGLGGLINQQNEYLLPLYTTPPAASRVPDAFFEIGKNIREQDNRCTSHPLFCIFEKSEIVGSEDHNPDRIAWVYDCDEVDDRTARRLEALFQGGRDTGDYSRCAMKSIDIFVTACFTAEGCKDYLIQNGHNLNRPFVYVKSAFRNDEYQTVRNWLASLPAAPSKEDA